LGQGSTDALCSKDVFRTGEAVCKKSHRFCGSQRSIEPARQQIALCSAKFHLFRTCHPIFLSLAGLDDNADRAQCYDSDAQSFVRTISRKSWKTGEDSFRRYKANSGWGGGRSLIGLMTTPSRPWPARDWGTRLMPNPAATAPSAVSG